MTVFRWNHTPMTAGRSTAGEDWPATLLRLVGTAMGDGRARSLTTWVIVGEGHDPVADEAMVGVSPGSPPAEWLAWPMEHYRVETDPPQFVRRPLGRGTTASATAAPPAPALGPNTRERPCSR
jgi:hypothetical protein